MIVQKTFLNKLKDFGLNTYESKLWTALLSRGISTAGELSDISNVPRSRTYDVLESLEKKGFIIMKVGKPIKYIAVPPEEVIHRVKQKIQEDAEFKNELIKQLEASEILDELTLLHNQGIEHIEPGDLSGSFKGRNNVYNQMESSIKKAKKSVYIMTTSSGILRKAEFLYPALKKAKTRGVEIKIAAPLTKDMTKRLSELAQVADIRSSKLDSRFIVIDESEVYFMLLDDKKVHSSYDTSVWVNTKVFGKTLSYFFEKEWKDLPNLS